MLLEAKVIASRIENYNPHAPGNRHKKGFDDVPLATTSEIQDALVRAENWAQTIKYSETDQELEQISTKFYELVFRIVAYNSLRVYFERTEPRSKIESKPTEFVGPIPKLEHTTYNSRAEEAISSNDRAEKTISNTAKSLQQKWFEGKNLEYSREEGQRIVYQINRYLMWRALLTVKTVGIPEEAAKKVQSEAVEESYALRLDHKEFKQVAIIQAHQYARLILENEVRPVELPIEILKVAAGVSWLEGDESKLLEQSGAAKNLLNVPNRHLSNQYILAFSMMPTQSVDRAARGAGGWAFPLDDAPIFSDANNSHAVTYFADGMTQEALHEGVMQLNPRTADVWRLCTAAILEAWGRGEKEPPRVWIDARELCDTMGFSKHVRGGHKPENIATAARALVDLERFHITIPYGTRHYPEDPKSGKRKSLPVQARAQHRVLAVMAKEEARELFKGSWLPMRWLITAGEWIKAYPREQFAPLFRALVELPVTYTPDRWAKAIGTELIWQYRQNEGQEKSQRVETMLKQACVLGEAQSDKNKKRVRDYFEKAMDRLQEADVCQSWEYNGSDIDQVESASRGWFSLWLETRVVVTPPTEVIQIMKQIAVNKSQIRRSQKRTEKARKVA